MALMSKTSSAARLSIIYITIGTLVMVWSSIYFIWLRNHNDPSLESRFYWCYGFLLSGLTVTVIGALLGPIGMAVRPAEVAVHGSGTPAPTSIPVVQAPMSSSAAPAAPATPQPMAQVVPVSPPTNTASLVTQAR